MLRLAHAALVLLVITTSSFAQGAEGDPTDPDRIPGIDEQSVGIVPPGPTAPIAVVEGPGIRLSENSALYPSVGADTGFVSNVFFEESNAEMAGVFRLIGQIGTGSHNARRRGYAGVMPAFIHREELRLTYDFYLSGDEYVSGQNGLGVAGTFRGTVHPGRRWSFLYLDAFERVIRAPNFESGERIDRNINRLYLGLQFAPPGRSVKGVLRYTNTIDIFEKDAHQFANRMQNAFGLMVSWRFRPKTVLFGDVSQGFNVPLGNGTVYAEPKTSSFPLALTTGVQTLLTLKTSLIARVGYTNGFYSTGASFGGVVGGVEAGWRYSPLGRVTAMYEYAFEDSINANYFRDHRVRLGVTQLFAPFALSVEPELRFRQYRGVQALIPMAPADTRDDFIAAVSATARYNFRDRWAAVAQYRFSTLQTNFRYTFDGDTDDPTFLRHELVFGIRAGL